MSKLFDLDSIPAEFLASVGGKARGLDQLIRNGYQVPQAFVVADIKDGEELANVVEKYHALGMEKVSVRSSATLEDGDDFSAAGQFSSFLNVSGDEELKKAIWDCVDSLNNPTVRKYSELFFKSANCKMTVIVQRMVDAKCAGVIFSHAPMRSGYTLVEAVQGLGENLVSGKMEAQQYRVKGTSIEIMPKDALLTKSQVIELGRLGKKAEEIFGRPMDLEWAMDADDNIHWLQARPITVGESVTMNELDCEIDPTNTVFTTGNIGEVMPGAVTPLTLSTNMLSLDWAIMKTYLDCGCIKEELSPYQFIVPYYNHMFFNMTMVYSIAHSVLGCTKEIMDISICGMVLDCPDSDMKDRSFFRKCVNMIPFMKLVLGGERAKKGMKKVVDELHFNLDSDVDDIYRQIIDNFKYLKAAHYYHYGASYYSGSSSKVLKAVVEKDFEDQEILSSLITGCLTQIEDFESANILRSMNSLAQLIIEDNPSMATADAAILEAYFNEKASPAVTEALEAFMARHGHRGILENEMMSFPWRDNRPSFCQSMCSVISSLSQNVSRNDTPWTVYAEQLLAKYKGSKRKFVERSILKARKGVCYREYTKSCIILVLDQFKQAYRKLAALMVEASILPDVESIFFLTQDEIGRLLDRDSSLVKKAIARKRLYPQQLKMRFPFVSIGMPQPISISQSNPNAKSFHGTPVSRGIATGIARVVHDEKDAAKLKPGEIMIAECVDIGWSPYYNIISGLVTEIGSALSHGVVVAREYALPTVVNVINVMDLIKTGDTITIDGNTGTVIKDSFEIGK